MVGRKGRREEGGDEEIGGPKRATILVEGDGAWERSSCVPKKSMD